MKLLHARWWITGLALLTVAAFTGPAVVAQEPVGPPATVGASTARGRVVRVERPEGRFTVRTADGKELEFHVDRMSRVRIGDREGKLGDLRVGSDVTVRYDVDDGRNYVNSVAAVVAAAPAKEVPTVRTVTARGKVVRVQRNPDVVLLDTADGELALPTSARTLIRVGDKDVRLADLTPGTTVSVTYELRPVATFITALVPGAGPARPARMEGKVLRVQAPDSAFVLRTTDGRTQSFYVAPESRLRLNNRAVKLGDLPVGATVAVTYDVRRGRYVVASVEGPAVVAPAVAAPVAAVTTGTIQGVVLEGDRPQPNLQVSLRSANTGREVAVQRTGPDGTFRFDKVAPGAYRLFSAKPDSQTTGSVDVSAQAGRVKKADIPLLRTAGP
jgi:hypothetical protein